MYASAPGKLIVSGEYAVVEGAPALVLAMNRRVVARRASAADPNTTRPTLFVRAVADQLATRGISLPPLTIDSSALYTATGEKLGLGSSAAVTVAAAALALARPTGNPTSALDPIASHTYMLDLDDIFDLALAAHRAAQSTLGAAGSGADVAAATYGGAIEYTSGQVRRVALPQVTIIPFAIGTSASTAPLVAQVLAARPDFSALAAASRRVCAATDAASLIAALADNAAAFELLAQQTGAPLVPTVIRTIAERVRTFGAIAKTTGAGGGDIGIVVAPYDTDRNPLHESIIQAGCRILDLSVDERGVDISRDEA